MRESKGNEGTSRDDDRMPAAGPSLDAPFAELEPSTDNTLLIVLLAVLVACLVSLGREVRRGLR